MLSDVTPAEIAVAEARRNVHESLTALSAWAADEVRAKVTRLEQAIERHVREQVALEIETTMRSWDGVGSLAFAKARGMRLAAAIARQANDTTSNAEPAASLPSCGVMNPRQAATCVESVDHEPDHRDGFGHSWPRRDGDKPLFPRGT